MQTSSTQRHSRAVLAGVGFTIAALLHASPAAAQRHRASAHAAHSPHAHPRHASVDRRAYHRAVSGWHDAAHIAPPTLTPDGRLVLRLWSVNTHAECEIVPSAPGAPFDDAAQAEFSRVLSDPRTHLSHEIDPQLMTLVYNVAEHFHAPQLTVISGFRANAGHSNHALGRAMDFLIPGVRDAEVAAYARTLGAVGVGIYPVSGFVHLDVRDTFYTWVDYSGPGSGSSRHRHHHHAHHRMHAARR